MKSTSRIFTVSGVFFFIVCLVYWFVSYEVAGTMMFGLWGGTLMFMAFFLGAAARQGAPDRDDPAVRPTERAGAAIGVFSRGSGWPVLLAAGLTVGLAGLIYGTWLLIPGAVVTIAALLGLMRETAAI